jgi:hypothetical protein
MKLNNKWFTITLIIVGTVPALILFIWCGLNGFGTELVRVFESIHPAGGFSAIPTADTTFLTRLPAVVINTLYAGADLFITGIAFSTLYNFFVERSGTKGHE